jgi:hypothetical protein
MKHPTYSCPWKKATLKFEICQKNAIIAYVSHSQLVWDREPLIKKITNRLTEYFREKTSEKNSCLAHRQSSGRRSKHREPTTAQHIWVSDQILSTCFFYRGIFVYSPWHWSVCTNLELHVSLDGGIWTVCENIFISGEDGSKSEHSNENWPPWK